MSVLPAQAKAQNDSYWQQPSAYLSAFIDRQSLGLIGSTVELHPLVASASFGFWVAEGIGLEVEAGVGVEDDTVGNLDLNFESTLGFGVRLESPPIDRVAAYALFSFIETSYEATVDGVSTSLKLPGGRMALGLTYRVSPNFFADASFTHHDYDEDARINSFRLGLRFDIGATK